MKHYCRTVKDVKNLGYKIKVFHTRKTNDDGSLSNKGGSTEVQILDDNGNNLSGISTCRDDEPFVKRIGIAVAIGRALKSL